MTINRLDTEALRTVAIDVAAGIVYTDRHGDEALDAWRFCFFAMPEKPDVSTWGMVYEYLDKAGPRTVNGRPSFFSMKVLHVDDMSQFFEFYEAEMVRRGLLPAPTHAPIPG